MKAPLQTLACGLLATCALAAPAFAARHSISWSGRVDDTVVLRVQGDQIQTRVVHGASPWHVSSDVNAPLPSAPVHVWLSNVHGRGSVELVREPSIDNNYTAVIRVKDARSGPGTYSFNLNWRTGFAHRTDVNGDSDMDEDDDSD